jgi:hypothetical protein
MLLLDEVLSLYVTTEYMLEDTNVVTIYLLLNLENVAVFGETIQFLSANSIDKSCLTNSISAY